MELPKDLYAKIMATAVVAKQVYDLYTDVKTKRSERTRWTVTLASNDSAYAPVQRWLMDNSDIVHRQIKLKSEWENNRLIPRTATNNLLKQRIIIKGHPIDFFISVVKGENGGRLDLSALTQDELTFHAHSQAGRDALVEWFKEICTGVNKERIGLYALSKWGEWLKSKNNIEKPLASVILKRGQTERIVQDIHNFLDNEKVYMHAGIPWHRGYLFYGPPGTGKTSIAKALATEFEKDLYFMSLNDIKEDSTLTSYINDIQPGSILVIEDVDVFDSARKRESDAGGLSMSGLLNALDGIATPHGLLVIMTTNNKDVLDPALTRPGRVDLQEEISYADNDQVQRMYKYYYGIDENFSVKNAIVPSQITEVFKSNIGNPERAKHEIQTLVGDLTLVG